MWDNWNVVLVDSVETKFDCKHILLRVESRVVILSRRHISAMAGLSCAEDVVLPMSMRNLSLSVVLPCEVPLEESRMALSYPTYKCHDSHCDCEQCTFELEGQFFFCDYYSLCYRSPADFHEYIVDCLHSWICRSRLLGMSRKPRVYGRVDSTLTCAGSRIWLYRFFVALPTKVKWTRLWEKMLYNASTGAGVPLAQDGRVRECFDVYPLSGMDCTAFARAYHQCKVAIVYDGADKGTGEGRFGNEMEVNDRCCSVQKHLVGRI